jgi:hypothetical protein
MAAPQGPGGPQPGMAGRPGGTPNAAFPGFHERNVARFTPQELGQWRGGQWRHDWHNGRYGWWWALNNAWYFYPSPVYPYPDYVSEDVYAMAPYAGQYWYYCPYPAGYYPYVASCYYPWQPVPAY